MELSELRQSISALDSELLQLLDERMELAKLVAEYKKVHNMPIFDAAREQEILEKIPKNYQSIWKEIMQVSKDIQKQYV